MKQINWDRVIAVVVEDIPNAIKTRRKYLGMTQQQLADESGLSLMSIRRYESGERVPDEDAIDAIAKALSIDAVAIYNPNAYEIMMREDLAPMEPVTAREQELLQVYRTMNEYGQSRATDVVTELAKIPEYKKEQPSATVSDET